LDPISENLKQLRNLWWDWWRSGFQA